ncbi:unnamed protein product [Spirodela intermedia]|uniref:Uncharacterized protein n=1 Tax=Spirodela intermedia TaxID=51605 RepID=A0A7I8LA09_SPIIN|nr:unnamed protein product [Spirodela intermedia]
MCHGASSSSLCNKRRLFIASSTLSGGDDSSLNRSLEINKIGCRIVSGSYHPVERKNSNFAALRKMSPNGEELDGGGAREANICFNGQDLICGDEATKSRVEALTHSIIK